MSSSRTGGREAAPDADGVDTTGVGAAGGVDTGGVGGVDVGGVCAGDACADAGGVCAGAAGGVDGGGVEVMAPRYGRRAVADTGASGHLDSGYPYPAARHGMMGI